MASFTTNRFVGRGLLQKQLNKVILPSKSGKYLYFHFKQSRKTEFHTWLVTKKTKQRDTLKKTCSAKASEDDLAFVIWAFFWSKRKMCLFHHLRVTCSRHSFLPLLSFFFLSSFVTRRSFLTLNEN